MGNQIGIIYSYIWLRKSVKKLGKGKEITKAEPPQYLQPITHRRRWSKVREQAVEKVGVLRVLLEEANKHGGQNLSGCTRHKFVIVISAKGQKLHTTNSDSTHLFSMCSWKTKLTAVTLEVKEKNEKDITHAFLWLAEISQQP